MRGSAELAQLAELFRIGARTARQIAGLRADDGQIERLASEVEAMADELDAIASGCVTGTGAASKAAQGMQ